jgi:hypothetical protein
MISKLHCSTVKNKVTEDQQNSYPFFNLRLSGSCLRLLLLLLPVTSILPSTLPSDVFQKAVPAQYVKNPANLPSFYNTQDISLLPDSMQYYITQISVSQTGFRGTPRFRQGVSGVPRDENA